MSTFHTLPALYVAYQLGYNFDRFDDWIIELAMIILGINALVANIFELKTIINESKGRVHSIIISFPLGAMIWFAKS